jgi:hypothetical protein
MKSRNRLIFSIIVVIFTALSFTKAWATDPTVTVNYTATGLVPGSTINVPVTMTGSATNVGSWQLVIRYDRGVLTYQNTTDGTHGGGIFNTNNLYVNGPGDTVYKAQLAYTGGGTGYALTGTQTLFTINFTYNGGNTNFTFINIAVTTGQTASQYTYVKANPYTVVDLLTTFVNGSAGGPGVTITSLSGGGNWNTAGTWDLGHSPNNSNTSVVIASAPATPVLITTNVSCVQDLTINAGGALTLTSGKTLTVGGNFLIKSDASGSGSFVDMGGTLAITGTTTVQRYMSGNWVSGIPAGSTTWHYISSPISGGVINTFLGDLLNSYNEPLNQWDSLTIPVTIPLTVGRGYAAAPHTPGGIRSFGGGGGGGGGTLNTGDLTISTMSFTALGGQGYNLIGNPFPSPVKWDATWTKSNVDATAWVWNAAGGSYLSNNGITGTFDGIIPAEQAFFVKVSAAGSSSITIPNAKRQHSTQTYYKEDVPDLINLRIEGNTGYDEAVIYFSSDATVAYDNEFDAYKLFAEFPRSEIYSVIGANTKASINVLPDFQTSAMIPIGIRTGATGSYTLTASHMESFPAGTLIFLEDLGTPNHYTFNLIDNPVYTFTADAGEIIRFNLDFFPVGIPETGSAGNIRIYSNQKDVYVNIPTSMKGNIIIYNLLGSEISSKAIQANTLNRISLNSPTGYYIVKVIGDNGITTGKVFIQ